MKWIYDPHFLLVFFDVLRVKPQLSKVIITCKWWVGLFVSRSPTKFVRLVTNRLLGFVGNEKPSPTDGGSFTDQLPTENGRYFSVFMARRGKVRWQWDFQRGWHGRETNRRRTKKKQIGCRVCSNFKRKLKKYICTFCSGAIPLLT